jgi:hypothetical protein
MSACFIKSLMGFIKGCARIIECEEACLPSALRSTPPPPWVRGVGAQRTVWGSVGHRRHGRRRAREAFVGHTE